MRSGNLSWVIPTIIGGLMNKYERQIQLEELYNKNQLIPRIKKEFTDSELGFGQYFFETGIDEDFGYAVLTQMALHKRCDIPTLLGCVAHVLEDAQASANMLEQCVNADLLDYHEDLDILIVKYQIADEVQHELDQFQFPLPMVVKPQKLTENSMTGYLDSKGSVILKKNHHEDDVCLDHINRVNRVPYILNMHVVNFISNKWKNIDKRKPGESLVVFNRRKKAFEKYNNTCSNVFALLNQETKQFYLTHRYDKRGRVYCMGHHVNYQGNDWNKACVEFAQKETVSY